MDPKIKDDVIVLKEYHKGAKSSHYWFIRTPEDAVPVHVSSLTRSGSFAKTSVPMSGFIQYEIPLLALERFDRVELYLFMSSNRGPLPAKLYVLHPKRREVELANERLELHEVEVSSGSDEVDSVVSEITAARDYWSEVFCKRLVAGIHFSRVDERRLSERGRYASIALKATYAYDYFVRGSREGMWKKLAKEYQTFALALIHEILSSAFELIEPAYFARVYLCSYLTHKRPFSRSGPLLRYRMGESGEIAVELEPRPSWADIAVTARAGGASRTLLVECKQGPPELWIEKALRQSKRYKAAGDSALLLALKPLPEGWRKRLLERYDYVIDNCAPARCGECKRKLSEALSAWLAQRP